MYQRFIIIICFVYIIYDCNCQMGPDPWDVESYNTVTNEIDLPPDLRLPKKVIETKVESSQGMSDWFYKRLLAILLKGGQKMENEDSLIDVSLRMKYNQEQIDILDAYIASNHALSEDMYRRSIGLIEKAIYKPTITEELVIAWNEYIYIYLVEYKEYLTWGFTIVACTTGTFWLWRYISCKHMLILLGVLLYLYEAFISYKEAEKDEVVRFFSAINACKWYFWTSECNIPPPDPLIMLKHMNPLKIGLRMLTTFISEPMVMMSSIVNTMVCEITDNLWYPLNVCLKVVLLFGFYVLLIVMAVLIICNYVFNIHFQLNFFNILSIVLPKQYGTMTAPIEKSQDSSQGDRISGETLNKFLDVCSMALNATHTNNNSNNILSLKNTKTNHNSIKRSASAGRLSNVKADNMGIKHTKKKFGKMGTHEGSGDAKACNLLLLKSK